MTFNEGVEIMVHFIQTLAVLLLMYGGVLAFLAAFGCFRVPPAAQGVRDAAQTAAEL